MKEKVLLSLTFLCWELANIHGFVEDFDSQGQSRGQSHLSFFVVLLQHGHGRLRPRGQRLKTKQRSMTQFQTANEVEHCTLRLRLYRTVKNNKLLFKNLPTQTYSTVVADAGCLPASVVTAGVTLIQLKTIVFVPAHVEQRHTKWSLPCQDTPEAEHLVFPQHPDCDIKS